MQDALARARRALTAEAYTMAWAAGSAMSLDAALAAARQVLSATDQARPNSTRVGMPAEPLTPREHAVAHLVIRDCSDRQIASELGIARRTAGLHVRHILGKLVLRSRWQVRDWAAAHGLDEPAPVPLSMTEPV